MRLLGIKQIINRFFSADKKFAQDLLTLTGISPKNIAIYKQAFLHSSVSGEASINNERLEYLGDAILDAVISEILFIRFPKKKEGFLTEMRSKMVSRKMLGEIARNMGIQEMITHNNIVITNSSSVLGNALEALIGAIYIDAGFHNCKRFILEKIIKPHVDINRLKETQINFKSKLVEWSQKNNRQLEFVIIDEKDLKTHRIFTSAIMIDKMEAGKGEGPNKKSAENQAARKALLHLGVLEN